MCSTRCDPNDCGMPGFPVLHHLRSLLKFMPIESAMLPNHLILCHPLLLLPSIFPSIRVSSKELAVRIKWSKYWKGKSCPNGQNSRVVVFKCLMSAVQSLCRRKVPGKQPFERIRVNMTRNNAYAHQLDWKTSEFVGHRIEYLKGSCFSGKNYT